MTTESLRDPLVAIQIVMVRRKGMNESLQSLDIPIRNERDAIVAMDADEKSVSLSVDIFNNPDYKIAYVHRTHEAAGHDGKLHPYCDGIYGELDMAALRTGLEMQKRIEVEKLEKKLKRRDATIRKLRKMLRES